MGKLISDFKKFKGGGLDTDSSIDDVAVNDWIRSHNTRVTGTQEGEEGEITNIESTTLITMALPSGINVGMGADKFETVRKAYGVRYNSQLKHQVIELDYDTLTETVLLENLTNTNNIDILPLNPRMMFNDIRLVQDEILILTDNYGEVYYINVRRLKSGQFAFTTAEDIVFIQGQPLKEPTFVYNNDSGRATNLLANRLFQFREQFEKYDYRETAWGTISKRNVPIDEPTPVIGTDVTKNNNLIVSVDAGTDRVVKIRVAARYDLLDWFLVKSIDRTTVVALPNTTVDVEQEIYEAYNPATNIYSFAFYNDGNYVNLNVLETDHNYDHVPRWCGALEDIQGSIIILGDLTEGYERPVVDVSLSVSTYDPLISRTDPPANSLTVVDQTNERVGPNHERKVTVTYSGLPKTGDVLWIRLRDIRDSSVTQLYAYNVPSLQQNNLSAVLASFSVGIPQSNVTGGITINILTTPYFELDGAWITLQNSGTGASKSIHCLKSNSSYQLALEHLDAYGRYFPLASDERFVIKTNSLAQTRGLVSQIDWKINSLPPVGAASAQWMISVNNTHQTDLWVSGVYDPVRSDNDYLVFNISSLVKFNEVNTSSILGYEWTSGDRVTLHFTYVGTSAPVKWFDSPSIDVEVVGLEIVPVAGPPETEAYYLKVRKSSALSLLDITGRNVMLEVYSPKKRITTSSGVTTPTETLFFEFGERIGITNGTYDQTSGTIRDGDCYFKTRSYVGSTDSVLLTFTVEDFNFSDYYKSDYTSYGRPRLYDDEMGQTRKKASIRWSDKFVTGSMNNGLARFYGERIYGEGDGETSSSRGAIGKLRMRDNYIVCLQELGVGHIPVNISIVEDQVEQRQYAISDKLLNFIRYISNYGIGTAKESFAESFNGTMYFVDPNASLPIRDGYDGVKVIAGKNMKYFRRVLKQAKAQGRKIIGYYDDYNNEWNVSIEVLANILTSFTFNTGNWLLVDGYVVDPSTITITVQNNVSVIVDPMTGIATVTPAFNYAGAAGFTFTFLDGINLITKNVCITVEEGSTTVNPFYFVDLINQELSTVVFSNTILIGGPTIPVAISITGGQYSKNGGAYTGSTGTVISGDVVQVRQTTSGSYTTMTSAVLTVGSYFDSFDATTKSNTYPTPFTFDDVTEADTNTLYESNIITISGLSGSVPISIVGGEYRINGGAWVSSAGTVANSDTVQARNTSSSSPATAVDATLTVGSYSDTYSITTKETYYTLGIGEVTMGTSVTVSAYLMDQLGNPVTVSDNISFDWEGISTLSGPIGGSDTLTAGTSQQVVGSYDTSTDSWNSLATSNAVPNSSDGILIQTTS